MTLVVVVSEVYGSSFGVCCQITKTGMLARMVYRPPTGTALRVHFKHVYDANVVAEIVMNVDVAGFRCIDDETYVVLRFVGFAESNREIDAARIQ